jgi:hypothetical protein
LGEKVKEIEMYVPKNEKSKREGSLCPPCPPYPSLFHDDNKRESHTEGSKAVSIIIKQRERNPLTNPIDVKRT